MNPAPRVIGWLRNRPKLNIDRLSLVR